MMTMLGRKHTEETKQKCRLAKQADRNPMWVGDHVSYSALHTWVKARLPKPEFCDTCKIKPSYDCANKGVYNRELKNWHWLCRHCHMEADGRMKNLRRGGETPFFKGHPYYPRHQR